jgi:hypothetical protein
LAYRADGTGIRAKDGLENVPGYVEDTGEVNWLVEDALHLEFHSIAKHRREGRISGLFDKADT